MALNFDIAIDGDLLTVTTIGFDENVDEAVAYGEAIISKCIESQCSKILVDESKMSAVLDTVGQYEMVQRLISLIPYQLSIALLTNPDHFQDTSFGTMVAENRGVHIKTFTSAELASQWLQNQT